VVIVIGVRIPFSWRTSPVVERRTLSAGLLMAGLSERPSLAVDRTMTGSLSVRGWLPLVSVCAETGEDTETTDEWGEDWTPNPMGDRLYTGERDAGDSLTADDLRDSMNVSSWVSSCFIFTSSPSLSPSSLPLLVLSSSPSLLSSKLELLRCCIFKKSSSLANSE
jgi:hypothetical protein